MVEQLVERIRNKDQQALKQLYLLYVEELTSVCHRYVPDDDDAKDVLQNSFVKIFTSIPAMEYRGEKSFKGWMRKVVVNEALSFLRGRRNWLRMMQEASPLLVEDDEEPEVIHRDVEHKLNGISDFLFHGVSPFETFSF